MRVLGYGTGHARTRYKRPRVEGVKGNRVAHGGGNDGVFFTL